MAAASRVDLSAAHTTLERRTGFALATSGFRRSTIMAASGAGLIMEVTDPWDAKNTIRAFVQGQNVDGVTPMFRSK
jgi:hypothetical protein